MPLFTFSPFAAVALLAYLATILRVLAWRRQGARHRHHVSWIAWVLVVVMGGSTIEVLLHTKAVGVFEAGTAALIALFVFGVRGNVARMLWSS